MASKPQELAIKKPTINCPVHWVAWQGYGLALQTRDLGCSLEPQVAHTLIRTYRHSNH